MKELIELLNNTDSDRVFGYSIVFLIALALVVKGLVEIVKILKKK